MFSDLNVFKTAFAMAAHAGKRQAVIAQNVSNADTPGYAAKDVPDFSSTYQLERGDSMRATRPGHFDADRQPGMIRVIEDPDAIAEPNGNSVSVEMEMMKAVDAKRSHDRALAIYRSGLSILRTSLGRG
ncbi:FlgB family protein [Heliomarina baculiformis]|uniref:FlgB family protein n=1 Tax=Heliomarina baculiformis TaxID=2872036 RepID=UPI001EE1AA21|nr:FlgB family protein [Heliomarina baculiformis]